MNASYFYVWERVQPFLKEIWSLMKTDWKQKIGWEDRLRQAMLWGIVCAIAALPITPMCLWLADRSGIWLVSLFWAIIGGTIASMGVIGWLIFICAACILFCLSVCRSLKEEFGEK